MAGSKFLPVVILVFFIVIACTSTEKAVSQEIPRMTKEELKANLGNDDFVIIDVRTPKDYDNSDAKIKGAIRENPMDVTFWFPYPKDKTIVLY